MIKTTIKHKKIDPTTGPYLDPCKPIEMCWVFLLFLPESKLLEAR